MIRKTKPVPIRLNAELKGRLQRAAKKMGASRSTIIRFAILDQLPDIESGRIVLRSRCPRKVS